MSLRILILSDVRFLREGLAQTLTASDQIEIVGTTGSLAKAEAAAAAHDPPDLVLLDTGLPEGVAAIGRLAAAAPAVKVVALGVAETESDVIAWAMAGAAGYVARSVGLAEVVDVLRDIARGELSCPPRVAAMLFQRIGVLAGDHPAHGEPVAASALTARELQIARLVGAGLSNKEIARQLGIGVATAKSHVHNVLTKLNVERRSQVAGSLRQRLMAPRSASGLLA